MNKNCQDCNLHHHRKNVVVGQGSPTPKIIVVGTFPSKDEDSTGRALFKYVPKLGKEVPTGYGRVIHSVMRDAGLSYSDYYVTNLIKCRTPNGRQPEGAEIGACLNHLYKEIKVLNCNKLLLLGDLPSAVLSQRLMWKGRGTVRKIDDNYIISTLHPSDLMANQEYYSTVVGDITKLFTYEETPTKENYLYNPSKEEYLPILAKWKDSPVAVDIETSGMDEEENEIEGGLDPSRDTIVGIALCGEIGKAIQFNYRGLTGEVWYHLTNFLEAHPYLVFQNNTFDRTFLLVNKNIKCNCYYDTMNGMHLIDSRLPKKLDFLRSLYTNEDSYKSRENYARNLAWLNAKDVDITLQIMIKQKDYLKPHLMHHLIKGDNIAMKMKQRGVKISKEAIAKHYSDILPKIKEFEDVYVVEKGILLSSPKQVSNYVFNTLGFTPPASARRGGKNPSVDEEVLNELIEKYCIGNPPERQILEDIIEYRTLKKTASTYCEGLFKSLDSKDRLHPPWSTTGTDTMRWKCKKPNMMNIPKWMRDVVIPEEGKVLMGLDYSKMQVWGAAILSKDEDLVNVLKTSNVHKEVLKGIELIYPLTEKVGYDQALLRAKAVVFGTLFGRTASDIALEFRTTPEVAKMWQDGLLTRFPALSSWLKEQEDFWKVNNYTIGIYGHKKFSKKPTEAKNFPVQNFEAMVVQNAMHALDEAGYHLILNVHDQLVCEEDESKAEETFKKMQAIMETSSSDIYPFFPVEGKIGHNWKEL